MGDFFVGFLIVIDFLNMMGKVGGGMNFYMIFYLIFLIIYLVMIV